MKFFHTGPSFINKKKSMYTQQTNNRFPVKLKANILLVDLQFIFEKWSFAGYTELVKIRFEIDQK